MYHFIKFCYSKINNFFLIRDDREVKYGKENKSIRLIWLNLSQNVIDSYNKINISLKNKEIPYSINTVNAKFPKVFIKNI